MTALQKAEQQEAIERLRKLIKPGDTIHCLLRHRAASGMSRVIQLLYVTCTENGPSVRHIGYNAAMAMGMKYDREREGIKIGLCGMDMGFALVYDLGRTLWPDGYDSDEWDGHGNRVENNDGGYALKHCWL